MLTDRLKVDDAKIEGMILSLQQLDRAGRPIGLERFNLYPMKMGARS